MSQLIFLSSARSKMAMVRLPAMNPAQKLNFFLFTSAEGKGAPLPFWGPSQSFGFSLFPLPMSGDLRSLSTNICLSPLWPTFFLNGHFFDGLILSIQREDSISLTSSSPWAITWHKEELMSQSFSLSIYISIYIYIYICVCVCVFFYGYPLSISLAEPRGKSIRVWVWTWTEFHLVHQCLRTIQIKYHRQK